MSKQIGTIAKLNLKNIRTPYFVTGIVTATMFVQTIVYAIIMANGGTSSQASPSFGNYFWLLIVMAAIFIPAKHFKKTVNLGGKRDGFFWGSLGTYAVLAGVVSLATATVHYTFDRALISTGNFASTEAFLQDFSFIENHYVIFEVLEIFGWTARGPIFAVIQQFAFLLLLAVVVHTLTAIQDKWYGWVTDAVIAAILATFIPIPVLRPALLWFFEMILVHSNAAVQITVCLALSAVIYSLNKPIFARKVI
jgi:hypothetical protein